MNNGNLWETLLSRLEDTVIFLPDKPEETAETTLKALWFTASGDPKSAEASRNTDILKLDKSQEILLANLVDKRISGVPLAHITGRQQFMGVELLAGPQALVPRKETEILGNAASLLLTQMDSSTTNSTLIDICTGAGNLAVALTVLHPDIKTYAADLSEDAVSLARKNVQFHHLEKKIKVEAGDLMEPFNSEEFYHTVDLLTCNPPYISSAKVETMTEEISGYEPRLAFDGGTFGIKILKRLIKEAPLYLKKNGWLAFEVGLGQGPSMVKQLEKNKNFDSIQTIKDFSDNIRAICVKRI